ncbi:hypothetical protein CI238_09050 [Colletotrichum incanum]|uniref:Uncharacterized protein n=1 Tax=Colletotrichum incanum TaxID=1573173 RepID=A0A167AYL8_COLIC|nr:hypothetical protein CI238_09050 [Colletotrichum incanum]
MPLPSLLQPRLGVLVALQELLQLVLSVRQRRRLALLGVLQLHDAVLRPGDSALDEHDAQFVVYLEHRQVLHCDTLVAHAPRHLFSGEDSGSGTLRRTRGTDGAVVERVTVGRLLTREAVALHTSGEAHAATVGANINILARLEPVREQLRANGQQPLLGSNLELGEVALGRDALGLVVAQQRALDVAGLLGSRTDLDGPVTVLRPRLVGDDLDLVELEDGAGDALLAVVDGRHALLDGEHAGPQGRRLLAAGEGGGGTGGESGQARGRLIEAGGLAALGERRPAVLHAALRGEREEVKAGAGEDGRGIVDGAGIGYRRRSEELKAARGHSGRHRGSGQVLGRGGEVEGPVGVLRSFEGWNFLG